MPARLSDLQPGGAELPADQSGPGIGGQRARGLGHAVGVFSRPAAAASSRRSLGPCPPIR
jgi:hypothetical protein